MSGDSMKSKNCPEGYLEMGVTTTLTFSEGEDNNATNNVSGQPNRNSRVHADVNAEGVPARNVGVAFSPSSELNMRILSIKETGSETGKDRMDLVFAECGMTSEAKPRNSNNGKGNEISN
ncbi:hypothetical protein AVEN_153232-1 [Araneus ventricosus]|uniref:Uncharacterized protein n=1 Tax=Araneus ventricosus TaxID=182803 RepID=A0A4Y2KMQ2_ARAVE|nr:hypothetical protein AVEN_153232-1 [Araneus ventricosus]